MDRQPRIGEAIEHYLRGVRLRQDERWDEALAEQARAVELQPDLADAHYETGVIHLHARRAHDALSAFVRALEAEADSPEAHYGRGCAYRQLKRYEDALDAFNEALRLRPDYPLAWEEIGIVYGLLRRYDESVAAFQRALRSEPTNPRVHCALGHAFVMTNRLDLAGDELRALEELDDNLAGLLRAVIDNAGRGSRTGRAQVVSISGRNQLRGTVVDVKADGLVAQVRLAVGDQIVTAIVTRDAADELGLGPGDPAIAIIKATEVMIAREEDR